MTARLLLSICFLFSLVSVTTSSSLAQTTAPVPADVVPLSPAPFVPQQADPMAPPPAAQPLAPGPATTQQPAPVNSGNYNVPAPENMPQFEAPPPPQADPMAPPPPQQDPMAPPPEFEPPPPPQDVQPEGQSASTVLPEPVMPDPKKEVKKKTLATVRTSAGNFTIKLFVRQAPRTTRHFIDLVRGEKEFIDAKTGQKVRRPFYNGLIFHRVIKNFIVQGGCPFGNGTGGPGYTVADEFTPILRHRKPGIVSMANAGQRDSNGSQFFISLAAHPEFDDKYTVFGEVVQGMDVIRDIGRVRVGPTDRPVKRITIIGVDIHEQDAG